MQRFLRMCAMIQMVLAASLTVGVHDDKTATLAPNKQEASVSLAQATLRREKEGENLSRSLALNKIMSVVGVVDAKSDPDLYAKMKEAAKRHEDNSLLSSEKTQKVGSNDGELYGSAIQKNNQGPYKNETHHICFSYHTNTTDVYKAQTVIGAIPVESIPIEGEPNYEIYECLECGQFGTPACECSLSANLKQSVPKGPFEVLQPTQLCRNGTVRWCLGSSSADTGWGQPSVMPVEANHSEAKPGGKYPKFEWKKEWGDKIEKPYCVGNL